MHTGGRNETADLDLGPRIGAAMATFRRYPELALLALLLLLTATFSREFSKGASIGPIYVTEVVMVLSGAIAVLRHGIRESWRLLRRLPLPALALIWVVGAIAALRGLSDYSLDFVENDIGLVDYTLLLPLLALVVADRERYGALYGTLVACGFLGMAAFALAYTADQVSGEPNTLLTLQGSAAGLYMSLGSRLDRRAGRQRRADAAPAARPGADRAVADGADDAAQRLDDRGGVAVRGLGDGSRAAVAERARHRRGARRRVVRSGGGAGGAECDHRGGRGGGRLRGQLRDQVGGGGIAARTGDRRASAGAIAPRART